eukprot:jgi/Antlo1/429/1759
MVVRGKLYLDEHQIVIECIWRSIKLQKFRLIPFITYSYSNALIFVGIYVLVHCAAAMCEVYIFRNIKMGLLTLLYVDAGLFVLLTGIFCGMAYIYCCMQRGPIVYRKYLYIAILSNVYCPFLVVIASITCINKYFVLIAAFFHISITHFLTYKNMPFLAIQEGKQFRTHLVILLNNTLFVTSVICYIYLTVSATQGP